MTTPRDRSSPPPLDLSRIERVRPDLITRRWWFGRRLMPEAENRFKDRIRRAPAHAALVLSAKPLVVGAYCAEIDTVVLCSLPDELADLVGPPVSAQGQGPARRLVTLNRLRPIEEGFAEDLEPGPLARGLHGDVVPFLADLVCAPGVELAALQAEVKGEEWERCRRFGLELLGRDHPRRDGRPLRSEQHGQRGRDPLSELPPRTQPPRKRRALRAAALLVLLVTGFVGFAHYFLRHVPYRIPAELRAPPPGADALLNRGLRLRYLGTAGFEVSDGQTTLWIDPAPTRPTLLELVSGPLEPDVALHAQLGLRIADAILVDHGHYDHVLDVPALALRSGAKVVGTQSVLNYCRSRGVPAERLILAEGGRPITIGTFTIVPYASSHGPIGPIRDPMAGVIAPDAGPLWFWQFEQDGTRSYRLEANGASVYVSAGGPLPPGTEYASGGRLGRTGTVILGLAAPIPRASLEACLREVQPGRVIANHFDNFFHPISEGLSILPVAMDPSDLAADVAGVDSRARVHVLDYGERMFLPPDGE